MTTTTAGETPASSGEPCPHAIKLDNLVHALAVAHGRSIEAERLAWGIEIVQSV